MITIITLWRFSFRIALIASLGVGISIAQDKVIPKIMQEKVPPEVQKIVDETMTGQHGLSGFESFKIGMGFDSSTKLADLKAGEPCQVYYIDQDSLIKMDETVPFSAIARRLDIWEVPVLINGKCVTTFEVQKTPQNLQWRAGTFHGRYKGHRYDEWQNVMDAWPKSAGYNPVIVYSSSGKKFFHVPEINDTNLTPLRRRSPDLLVKAADSSFKILMPSKTTLKYLKVHLPSKLPGGAK